MIVYAGSSPLFQHLRHRLGKRISRERNCIHRVACDMRRQGDVIQLQKRRIRAERLIGKDIQRRAGDPVFLQRFDQRLLIDQTCTRGIDQIGSRFHLRKQSPADHPLILLCQAQMKRNHIRLPEKLLQAFNR